MIAVQIKQKHKDFTPQRIDPDFVAKKSDDPSQNDKDSTEKEIFPIKFNEIRG